MTNRPSRRKFLRMSGTAITTLVAGDALAQNLIVNTQIQTPKSSPNSTPTPVKSTPIVSAKVIAPLPPPSPIVLDPLQNEVNSITVSVASTFPSKDAPGSKTGGYNIIFILTDQEQYMGADWAIPLPGHERLKKTGTFFENHQVAASTCSTSRAVIYTGLHMPKNGIFDNAGAPYMKSLSPKIPTIGKILRKMGYYTAYKGKFNLSRVVALQNSTDQISGHVDSVMDHDYGFYDYANSGDFIDGAQGGYQYDAVTTAQSIQWLKSKGQKMATEKQPWFLAINLVNPHDVAWVNTDKPGGAVVQGKDPVMDIDFVPDDKFYVDTWNDVPLQL